MEDLLARLIHLQELTFARLEHQAVDSRFALDEIKASIDRIMSELPGEWVRLVNRLQSQGQPAVVPATNGFCSFCRIELPTAMFQEIQKQSRIHRCPCCARILYLPEGGTMLMGEGASRFGQGGLARFSSEKLMVQSLRADSRDEALDELIQALTREGWVDAPEQVSRTAIDRENLVTTAVESGLAFPHVRGFEGGGLIINLGLKRKGLRFGAPRNRLTRIIFFAVIPQAASGFYLRVMASLVKVFREEAARKRLLDCTHSEQVWDTLLDLTQEEFP